MESTSRKWMMHYARVVGKCPCICVTLVMVCSITCCPLLCLLRFFALRFHSSAELLHKTRFLLGIRSQHMHAPKRMLQLKKLIRLDRKMIPQSIRSGRRARLCDPLTFFITFWFNGCSGRPTYLRVVFWEARIPAFFDV